MKASDFPATGQAIISLGSNLGDSRKILLRAFEILRARARPTKSFFASSLWRSAPVNCPLGSPDFVNAVCVLNVASGETPEALMEYLQALEKAFGRQPKTKLNEPRPLDLDIIGFGHLTRQSSDLVIPHPRAHERRFVLAPLAELLPDRLLPGWPDTVLRQLQNLPARTEDRCEKMAGV